MALETFAWKGAGRGARRKLSREDVAEIKSLSGVRPQSEIAATFGVNQSHVSRIINGQRRAKRVLPEDAEG